MITLLYCLFLFTLNRTGYAVTAGAAALWFFLGLSLVLDAILAALAIVFLAVRRAYALQGDFRN